MKNGGHAYPRQHDNVFHAELGMTLRDRVALSIYTILVTDNEDTTCEDDAQTAYDFAQAFIDEKHKRDADDHK